jgi:hypothetical protein
MTLITAQAAGGLANATGTWVGGIVPVDGDTIRIPAGTTVTWNITTRTLGNKATGVGTAVEIRGSVGSSGKLIVNAGCTLTLRGFDRNVSGIGFGNVCLHVEQYGEFAPQPGSTILFDVASDGQSVAQFHGIGTAIGTSGSRISMTIPAANKNWNNSVSASTGFQAYEYYDEARKIGTSAIGGYTCLSNAAGTGPGTMADSSVGFSSITPASILQTPVASIALITSAGKYFVDHDGGTVFFYLDKAVSTSFQFTWSVKRLTYFGVGLRITDDQDGCQFVARYCDFDSLGSLAFGDYAVNLNNRYTAVGTNRTAEVTHSRFRYGRGVQMAKAIGTSGAPMLFDDNEFQGPISDGTGGPYSFINDSVAYVSIKRNIQRCATLNPFITNYGGVLLAHDHVTVQDNAVWSASFLKGGDAPKITWPDMLISGNFLPGTGGGGDSRQIANFGGTSGHPAVASDNVSWRPMRSMNFLSYASIIDNVIGHAYHHSINPSNSDSNVVFSGLIVRRNLQLRCADSISDLGYNTSTMLDQPEVTHNTIYNSLAVALALNFPGASSVNMPVGLLQSSNLVATATNGIRRDTDITTRLTRVHLRGMDYNNFYNLSGAIGNGGAITRLATVSGITNVTGVSLSNPTFSSPVSGKALVFTRTSATNQTLAFDGGTAVQIVSESGTATGGSNENAFGSEVLRGYLDNSTKSWSDADLTVTTTPVGMWVVITGGTGSGQVRRITDVVSGTQVCVAPKWTTVPDATSTYAFVKGEVLVTGTAGTMNAGIDARSLPGSTQTDSSVAVTFNGTAVDPQFTAPTRNLESWDTSLGGPGTEDSAFNRLFTDPTLTRTSLLPYLRAGFVPQNVLISGAAHDGTTIGAIPYVAPPFAADHLTITTQPSTPIASGAAHATQPVVAVKDAVGNTVAGDTSTVTATMVVTAGSATPLGTLTKVAVAGVADFSANGLGGTSVAGATFHWHFSDGVLTSADSASITIAAGGASADQFVVIAGLVIPVMEGQAIEQIEQGGSSQRAQAGNLLSDCPWEKLTWQATTGLMTRAEVAALKAAIAFRAHVSVSGLLVGGIVTCEVTWSNGAYINTSTTDGTGILRSLVLLLRQV